MARTEHASGWGCTACGYVFTPGTIDQGKTEVDPAWAFDSLPENWACPECGSAKHRFKRLKHSKDKKDR
jgi:rubredoxin